MTQFAVSMNPQSWTGFAGLSVHTRQIYLACLLELRPLIRRVTQCVLEVLQVLFPLLGSPCRVFNTLLSCVGSVVISHQYLGLTVLASSSH